MATQMAMETQEMTSRVICGQVCWPLAQAGKLLRFGSSLVALKIEKVVLSMESTISEQVKLVPRRKNLATRTRVLTFCTQTALV